MGRVLVVDDSKFMRRLYVELLEQSPLEVIAEATTGVEGVDAYREHDPDLVVMNIRMPILDGIEATEEILSEDPDATVVVCTGIKQEEKMKAALAAGATTYITKPFQRENFVAALVAKLDS